MSNGQTILAAAGDNSSSDGSPGANVDLPSSDPNIVACGGTSRSPDDTKDVVWGNGTADGSGTGGGYSIYFARPPWQTGNNAARMTPDLADVADPQTGLPVFGNWDGSGPTVQYIGGTSAVAPWLSGFIAAWGPKQGNILPGLWANPSLFEDVTSGSNGSYSATVGPDPCSGLGVLNFGLVTEQIFETAPKKSEGSVPPPTRPVRRRWFVQLFTSLGNFFHGLAAKLNTQSDIERADALLEEAIEFVGPALEYRITAHLSRP